MQNVIPHLLLIFALASCTPTSHITTDSAYSLYAAGYGYSTVNPPITHSLFDDKTATISEENIQKILDGDYDLPQELRVAFIRIDNLQNQRAFYWGDENHLKSQQQYLDLFKEKFSNSPRVKTISTLPDLLISDHPTYTSIRESAVRTQSDLAVIYTIQSDLYSQYKIFSKTNIKAFATTQLIILDVRTGLIPFTTIVTKDFQDKKNEADLNENEAAFRIKNQAILLTIDEIGEQITRFLDNAD